ncbi:hypothetical protein PRIPAC_91284 [Pristionchus pacificus]|uniref:G protein-coupled receptor n=1 Tax=Pristionchus pacificus TaxID=54126 RepID=A0A2A6CVF9_PRIPA|nr:hypothetical protein PRIPAC_91284 [Pristionchus pacificus]|eukprot:PDM82011.1 G protein-coupled receptor [Pristionchus pacificus]
MLALGGIFKILSLHRTQMSTATRKMHKRFVRQLGLQASVPFIVCVFPLTSLLLQIIFGFDFEFNWPGYVSLSLLLLHGPLTSTMTICLYEPYKKAVFRVISRRRESHTEVRPISVSSMRATEK